MWKLILSSLLDRPLNVGMLPVTESFGKIVSAVTLGWAHSRAKDGSSTTFNMKLIYIYVSVYFSCTILMVGGSHHIFFRVLWLDVRREQR